jgi:hypothetical protein
VPAPGCTCGYYAYADDHAALDYPNARNVLAVVACWGRVIAGTRGLRSEHARLEALWMSDAVPADLAAAVRSSYPGVITYTDKLEMLGAHPPTTLDCYQLETPGEQRAKAIGFRLAVSIALVAGLFPTQWLGNGEARIVWAVELLFFFAGAALFHRKRADAAAKRQTLLFVAVVLWLLAPFAGPAGTLLLRLPLLQIGVLTLVQRRMLNRAAGEFPARIGPVPR